MKFILFLRLALLNLLRFKRRTLLVGIPLTLSGAVLVFTNSLGNGIEKQLLNNLVFFQTGHLLLSPPPPGSGRNADSRWQDPPAGLEPLIERDRTIQTAQSRLETAVLLQARNATVSRAFLVGLDPARESPYLGPLLPVRAGAPLAALPPGGLLVSEEYAGRLQVGVGDPVSVTVSTPQSGTRTMDFRLAGIFRKGTPWQEFFLFAPLASVQQLVNAPGRVSSIRILLENPAALEQTRRKLAAFLQKTGQDWTVKTFQEAGGFSLGIVQANRFSILLMDSLLLSVSVLGVSLLVLLSIQLRYPEWRTLGLLGTPPGWLRAMIIQEALLLGLSFGTLGIVLGLGLSFFFQQQGLSVSSLPLTYLLGGSRLIPEIRWSGIVQVGLVLTACCLLSALIPLWQNRRAEFLSARGRN